MSAFPYRLRGDEAVSALTARLGDEFVAGALVCVGAHGFSMEIEMLQRAEGDFVYSSWNDVQGNISVEDRALPIELVTVVAHAHGLARQTLHGAGRRVHIVLADAQGGYWIDAPETGAPAELGELYALVFR